MKAGLVDAVEAALGSASESALAPDPDDNWDGYDAYDDDDYVGYHESYGVARDASAVLDELEGHLNHGRADLTLEPLPLAL